MSEIIEFTVPSSFKPDTKNGDVGRHLVSTIIRKTAWEQVDPYGYVRLHSDCLRRLYPRDYPALIRRMVNDGVLDRPAPHFPGVKSKGYRLSVATRADSCQWVLAKDQRLIRKILRERQRLRKEQEQRWLPVHHDLRRMQQGLTILDSADAILESLDDDVRLCQESLVRSVRKQEDKFSVSGTGRVFNLITGLKREIRKELRLEGQPIRGVDLACAQPSLLAMAMNPMVGGKLTSYMRESRCFHSISPPPLLLADASRFFLPDARLFCDLAVNGGLYDYLTDSCRRLGVPVPASGSRDWIKLSLLRDVFAKRGCYPCAFERAFSMSFPSVHGFIRSVNDGDHARLIRLLQRMESWLVIERVCPRLIACDVPIVPLHDAIYSRQNDSDRVRQDFEEVFADLGFSLTVKSES